MVLVIVSIATTGDVSISDTMVPCSQAGTRKAEVEAVGKKALRVVPGGNKVDGLSPASSHQISTSQWIQSALSKLENCRVTRILFSPEVGQRPMEW